MACITPVLFPNFLVWLVIVIAAVAIVNLFVPWLLAQLGNPDGGIVVRILQIVVWALVVIAIIYFVYDLLTCSGLLPIRR